MNKISKWTPSVAIIILGGVVPLLAGAATVTSAGGSSIQSPITSVKGLEDTLCRIFGWMFYGLIALSTIMIVWGAYIYVTAGDDTEKVSTARKTVMYAAIGIAVAVLARAVPLIVGDLLGAKGLSGC